MNRKSLRTISGTCPRCGAPNHEGLRVCAYCGTVLVEEFLLPVQTEVPVTVVEMPAVSARQEPEPKSISENESQPSVPKKKTSGFAAFLRWTGLWAVFCFLVVGFASNIPNRSESLLILCVCGVLVHLLIKAIPWLTMKVLLLLFNLFLLLTILITYYPNIPSWLLIAATAAAFIVRWRQLIRDVRQRG